MLTTSNKNSKQNNNNKKNKNNIKKEITQKYDTDLNNFQSNKQSLLKFLLSQIEQIRFTLALLFAGTGDIEAIDTLNKLSLFTDIGDNSTPNNTDSNNILHPESNIPISTISSVPQASNVVYSKNHKRPPYSEDDILPSGKRIPKLLDLPTFVSASSNGNSETSTTNHVPSQNNEPSSTSKSSSNSFDSIIPLLYNFPVNMSYPNPNVNNSSPLQNTWIQPVKSLGNANANIMPTSNNQSNSLLATTSDLSKPQNTNAAFFNKPDNELKAIQNLLTPIMKHFKLQQLILKYFPDSKTVGIWATLNSGKKFKTELLLDQFVKSLNIPHSNNTLKANQLKQLQSNDTQLEPIHGFNKPTDVLPSFPLNALTSFDEHESSSSYSASKESVESSSSDSTLSFLPYLNEAEPISNTDEPSTFFNINNSFDIKNTEPKDILQSESDIPPSAVSFVPQSDNVIYNNNNKANFKRQAHSEGDILDSNNPPSDKYITILSDLPTFNSIYNIPASSNSNSETSTTNHVPSQNDESSSTSKSSSDSSGDLVSESPAEATAAQAQVESIVESITEGTSEYSDSDTATLEQAIDPNREALEKKWDQIINDKTSEWDQKITNRQNQWNTDIEKLTKTYNDQINNLKKEQQEKLDQLNAQYNNEQEKIKNGPAKTLWFLNNDKEKQLAALEKKHNNEITKIQNKYNKQISKLEATRDQEIHKIQTAADKDINNLKKGKNKELDILETEKNNELNPGFFTKTINGVANFGKKIAGLWKRKSNDKTAAEEQNNASESESHQESHEEDSNTQNPVSETSEDSVIEHPSTNLTAEMLDQKALIALYIANHNDFFNTEPDAINLEGEELSKDLQQSPDSTHSSPPSSIEEISSEPNSEDINLLDLKKQWNTSLQEYKNKCEEIEKQYEIATKELEANKNRELSNLLTTSNKNSKQKNNSKKKITQKYNKDLHKLVSDKQSSLNSFKSQIEQIKSSLKPQFAKIGDQGAIDTLNNLLLFTDIGNNSTPNNTDSNNILQSESNIPISTISSVPQADNVVANDDVKKKKAQEDEKIKIISDNIAKLKLQHALDNWRISTKEKQRVAQDSAGQTISSFARLALTRKKANEQRVAQDSAGQTISSFARLALTRKRTQDVNAVMETLLSNVVANDAAKEKKAQEDEKIKIISDNIAKLKLQNSFNNWHTANKKNEQLADKFISKRNNQTLSNLFSSWHNASNQKQSQEAEKIKTISDNIAKRKLQNSLDNWRTAKKEKDQEKIADDLYKKHQKNLATIALKKWIEKHHLLLERESELKNLHNQRLQSSSLNKMRSRLKAIQEKKAKEEKLAKLKELQELISQLSTSTNISANPEALTAITTINNSNSPVQRRHETTAYNIQHKNDNTKLHLSEQNNDNLRSARLFSADFKKTQSNIKELLDTCGIPYNNFSILKSDKGITELELAIPTLEKDIADLEKLKQQPEKNIEEANIQIQTLKKQKDALTKNIQATNQKITALKAGNDPKLIAEERKAKISALEKEKISLIKKRRTEDLFLKKNPTLAPSDKRKHEAIIKKCDQQSSNIEQQIRALNTQNNKELYAEQQNPKKIQIQQLTEQNARYEQSIEELKTKINLQETEVQQQQATIDEQNSKISSMSNKLSKMKKQLLTNRNDIKALKELIEKEIANLEQSLSESSEENAEENSSSEYSSDSLNQDYPAAEQPASFDLEYSSDPPSSDEQ